MAGTGNQQNPKHVGERAIRFISEGEPFLGIALERQHTIEARTAAAAHELKRVIFEAKTRRTGYKLLRIGANSLTDHSRLPLRWNTATWRG